LESVAESWRKILSGSRALEMNDVPLRACFPGE
jgi:hypothetical protein